jgi:hypothetical protein
VFTEYRDTQSYLLEALGNEGFVLGKINGKMTQEERREQIEVFNESKVPMVLVATDAASEGLNLQDNCHTVINYELPWNPNRLEQRNGRVDRWGQTHDVDIFNFYLDDTLESDILKKLLEKIETIRKDLGSVSDLVGESSFDLSTDFIRFGGIKTGAKTQNEKLASKERALDKKFDENYRKIKEFKAKKLLVEEQFDQEKSQKIGAIKHQSMMKLPDFEEIREYFQQLIDKRLLTRGSIKEVSKDIYRIAVPYELRYAKDTDAIEEATFNRELALRKENKHVAFMTPSHPLIKQLFIFAKSLINSDKMPRVAARKFKTDKEGMLFNYYLKFRDQKGRIVAEYLHPVFVRSDNSASKDLQADESLLFSSIKGNIIEFKDRINAYADRFESMKSTAYTALRERVAKIEQRIMEQNIALIDEELAELEAWKQSVKEHYLDVYDQRQQTLDFDIDELKYRKRQFKRKMDELELRVKQKKKRIEDARHITMDEPLLLTAVVVLPGDGDHA